MASNSTKAMLRAHLKNAVDEDLLDYVAQNANKLLYITQEQFCQKACITSEQALSFFQAFGTDSFIAFKYILRKSLYYEATDLGVVKRPLWSLADESFHYELQNLTKMMATLDYEKIEQLAQDIWNASEVNIICFGSTKPLGFSLHRILEMFRIRTRLFLRGGKDDEPVLSAIDPTCLLIAFGFARYSRNYILRMKMLQQRGFRIVSITDSIDSPFIPLSDYHFILPVDSFDFNDSYSAGAMFLNILALCIGTQEEDVLFSRMRDFDIETQEGNMFW